MVDRIKRHVPLATENFSINLCQGSLKSTSTTSIRPTCTCTSKIAKCLTPYCVFLVCVCTCVIIRTCIYMIQPCAFVLYYVPLQHAHTLRPSGTHHCTMSKEAFPLKEQSGITVCTYSVHVHTYIHLKYKLVIPANMCKFNSQPIHSSKNK